MPSFSVLIPNSEYFAHAFHVVTVSLLEHMEFKNRNFLLTTINLDCM